MREPDSTLEPIHPIEETPYGALIIHNDILCTPTSLCTWSDMKPAVYCRLPPHTRNPVCLEVKKGIGLLGCFDEPSCGGIVPVSRTKEILDQNPQYRAMIRTNENKLKRTKKSKNKKMNRLFIFLFLFFFLFVIFMFGLELYQMYRKRKFVQKKKTYNLIQSRKHSTSRKISTGVGKIGKPSSR